MWSKQATNNMPSIFEFSEAVIKIEINEEYIVDYINRTLNYQFYKGLPADLHDEICEVCKMYGDSDNVDGEIDYTVERWLEDNDEFYEYETDENKIGSWDFTSKILANGVVNETIENMFLSVYYYALTNGLLWKYLDTFEWCDMCKYIIYGMRKMKKDSYGVVVSEGQHIFATLGLVPNKSSKYAFDCDGFMNWFFDNSPYCNDDKRYNLNYKEIKNHYEYISNVCGYALTGNGYYNRDGVDYLEGIKFAMSVGSFKYLSNCMSLDEDVCARYFQGKSYVDYENKIDRLETLVSNLYNFHRNRKERVEKVENLYLRARYNPKYKLCKKVLEREFEELSCCS
jgi:hypothetical protein